jgi:hypothetical protein
VGFPKDIDPERLKEWAAEHLLYEVTTLVYTTVGLGNLPPDPSAQENVLLESFAVHARCLDHFLWRDRGDKKPDSFATDFCAPGDWERQRDGLKREALDKIEDGHRFGREVMHLTYDRIDGAGDMKRWPCGEAALEIAAALERFASTALADQLDDETRAFLARLRASLEPKAGDVRPGHPIALIVGATAMDPRQFETITGGTTVFKNIHAGGAGRTER